MSFLRRIARRHKMTARPTRDFKTDILTPPVPSLTGSLAPMCHTCLRDVDEEELVETGPHHARVLVRHHGSEELHTFNFGMRQDWNSRESTDELSSRMRRRKWFDPIEAIVAGPLDVDKAGMDDHSVLS